MVSNGRTSGAFAKLWKATISFMSVRPFVRMENFGSHWSDFHDFCISIFLENLLTKFKFH